MMKKAFKYMLLTCLSLLIIFIFIWMLLTGGLGQKPWYYAWKGIYRIQNPKDLPSTEIVLDLNNTSHFIQKYTEPNIWIHPYFWQTPEKQNDEDGHIGLQTYMLTNPFSYLNLKLILNNNTFTIPNFQIMYINFKDYYSPEIRVKHPESQGIGSISIYCIECQPVIQNGNVIQRRVDYDFAIAQHKKLAALFDSFGFSRDIIADEKTKLQRNKDTPLRNPYDTTVYLEYKTWAKDNFEFVLILEVTNNRYINNIYIGPKKS